MVFHQQIILVAERFQQQYSSIFNKVQNPKDTALQERFTKATSYFIEQLNPIVDLTEDTHIPTDSKEHQTHLQNNIREITSQIKLKQKLLQYVQQHSFDPIDYTKQLVIWSIEDKLTDESAEKTNKKVKQVSTKQRVVINTSDVKNPELYKILTTWRANKAKSLSRPAYTVLHQKALIGIVNFLPSTIEELLITPSIGKVTIEKYGEELLEIVHNYRKEENSESPKSIFTEIKESEK
jgi:superfamily II DNA helicase RecQ